ncbi:hypothetical protein BDF22DRAFT_667186 [Syncephalis plumigaleata]|nr:hypothetical protein BDF22DRAFT_667186 [Syncephalis plumigaleata]
MDNTDLLVIDAPLCASSKSQSSLPSPRSIRSTRRTQSEDRNQAQRTSESSNERPSDSPTMEASSSRSSSRNSNTKRSASTTNDLSAYTPIIRSVSSSAIDNESTTRSNTRSFSTGLPTMANEHTTATTTTTTTTTNNINTILSHNEANIPLVKAASYNNASHVSVSSFVTANESMSGFRSRCTSDAADRLVNFCTTTTTYKDATTTTATSTTSQSQSSVHHGASALITPPGYESPVKVIRKEPQQQNSTSVDNHDGRPTPISVHNHDTIEQVLSSPSSSVISVSEITYSAHTDVTTPSYSGKLDNSSILSPRKTSPFSPLDITREKPELRRAYSYGSLSQPKPHRDFMQVDLSIWQSPDPQSPTQSSIASPGLEMQSTVAVDVAIPVKESSSNDKAALDQCNDVHHAESQQMIAQLQEQVANLQYQLASERAVRQELEELVTSLEQLRHKEIFGNNKTHRRVSASHRGSA